MVKNQIPTKIYLDSTYLENNTSWHTEDSPYKASLVISAITSNSINFSNCADIGCGAGLVTELLAENYKDANFVGYELSKDTQIFHKARKNLPNLDYTNLDYFASGHKYDLVICLDVFEHVEDYFGFLRNLKSRGQTFIFNIPLDMNVLKILTPGIKYAREEVGHLHYFNEYTAIQMLLDCGFQIRSQNLHMAYLSTPPRNIRQLAILPFRLLTLLFGKSFSAKIFGGASLLVCAE